MHRYYIQTYSVTYIHINSACEEEEEEEVTLKLCNYNVDSTYVD